MIWVLSSWGDCNTWPNSSPQITNETFAWVIETGPVYQLFHSKRISKYRWSVRLRPFLLEIRRAAFVPTERLEIKTNCMSICSISHCSSIAASGWVPRDRFINRNCFWSSFNCAIIIYLQTVACLLRHVRCAPMFRSTTTDLAVFIFNHKKCEKYFFYAATHTYTIRTQETGIDSIWYVECDANCNTSRYGWISWHILMQPFQVS